MTELFVALDFDSSEKAVRMATDLVPHVDGFKVGLELLLGPGPATIGAIRQLGKPVFADAKLHDIPNTVRGAARQLGRLGARYVSAHAGGGEAMLTAAVEGLADGAAGNEAGVLAISVLTSTAPTTASGGAGSTGEQVAAATRKARSAGAEGVVCPVRELMVVAQVAPSLRRVTPGIRDQGDAADDQLQTASAEEAVARGADIVIIGRPITRASDPVAAAAEFRAVLWAVNPPRG